LTVHFIKNPSDENKNIKRKSAAWARNRLGSGSRVRRIVVVVNVKPERRDNEPERVDIC